MSTEIQERESTVSDKIGITSAVLCTVHCLVVPALFLLKGWYSASMPTWWDKLDILFLLISFAAVYHSASHTKIKEIKLALWISWVVLAAAILSPVELHWLAYLASAGLITGHFLNIRSLRKAYYSR